MSDGFRVSRRALLVALPALLAAGPAAAERLALGITSVEIVPDSLPGQMLLRLALTPESRTAFAAFTGRHVGETIDLRVEGRVAVSVRIVEPILGGVFVVSSMLPKDELEALARRLEAGRATIEVEARDG
jgi:preprotein translocase subunit SecD